MLNKAELDDAIKVGETVDVQTSQYSRTAAGKPLYSPDWKPRYYATAAAVRALLRTGRYEGETFWRGAILTKLRD